MKMGGAFLLSKYAKKFLENFTSNSSIFQKNML
jgi:hypothetical protein